MNTPGNLATGDRRSEFVARQSRGPWLLKFETANPFGSVNPPRRMASIITGLPRHDDFIRLVATVSVEDARMVVAAPDVIAAAINLIADVRRRHPGEELRCEYMRALDGAISKALCE